MLANRKCEKRMDELAGRAAQTGLAQVAWFLSPAERMQADISARRVGVSMFEWGGTSGAERRVVAFAEEDWEPEWPVCCLRVSWHAKYGAPSHRDLLGSVLALGMARERIGDIYVGESEAHIFALADMARYIQANLERAGRSPVKVELLETPPALSSGEGETVRATVKSPRLDAVLSVAWNLSRGKAADLVSAGCVQVDHQLEMRPDKALSEGVVISVRGFGRAKVAEIGGKTKKDRFFVTLTRY